MAKVKGLDAVGRVDEGGEIYVRPNYAKTLDQMAAAGTTTSLSNTELRANELLNESKAEQDARGKIGFHLLSSKYSAYDPNGGGGGGGGGGASPSAANNAYEAAVLPSATSQADYINALYDANEQKRRAALEAQYTASVGALDQQAAKIPGQYEAAANQAAAQAAVNRANFNEMAAANGLNTGAAGQAALAQNNALLGAVSEIRKNQANALNDVEMQRVSLQQQYQKAIADAIASNDADRAAALYNEAKRVDESLVSTAVNQATENYRAWQAMYG